MPPFPSSSDSVRALTEYTRGVLWGEYTRGRYSLGCHQAIRNHKADVIPVTDQLVLSPVGSIYKWKTPCCEAPA